MSDWKYVQLLLNNVTFQFSMTSGMSRPEFWNSMAFQVVHDPYTNPQILYFYWKKIILGVPELIQPSPWQIVSKSIPQHSDPKYQLDHLSWDQELRNPRQVYLPENIVKKNIKIMHGLVYRFLALHACMLRYLLLYASSFRLFVFIPSQITYQRKSDISYFTCRCTFQWPELVE